MFKEVSEEVKEKRNKVIKKSCNNIEAGLNMLRAIDKLCEYIPLEDRHTIDKLKADWAVQTLEIYNFAHFMQRKYTSIIREKKHIFYLQ